MRKNPVTTKASAEQMVKDIRRVTRKLHSSEEKSGSCYWAFRARAALPSFAARRALLEADITAGPRNSLRPARSGLLATPLVRVAVAR